MSVNAIWDGRVITVSGELPIKLSDYNITPPDNGFVRVDDQGTLKILLLFVQSE